MDRATLLGILEQSAEALDFAHENGIVHRDIKPANIMMHRNSRVKIADFGIAKVLATQHHTKTGLVMGTPSYMSPEQIKAQPLDGRSDQFSLAVIAFEMLAGQKPFDADTLPALVHQIVYEEPRSLLELKPHLGREVDAVLRKALSKSAADRYPTCTQFVRALWTSLQTTLVEQSPLRTPESRGRKAVVGWVSALVVSSGVFFGVGYDQHLPSRARRRRRGPIWRRISKRRRSLGSEGCMMCEAAIAEYGSALKADPRDARAAAGRAKAVKAKEMEANVLK